jgi:type 2 lantibiotic biosynthesis protein LanM
MLAIEPLTLDVYLRALIAKASTLTERINQIVIPTYSHVDDSKIQSRLDFWCQVVAKGDDKQFQRRLAAFGLETEKLHSLLGEVKYPEFQSLPSWAQILEEILQTAQYLQEQNLREYPPFPFSLEKPIPFEPFYYPFFQVAQNQLLSHVQLSLLSENTQAILWQSLLERLQDIAIRTLLTEFFEFRSSGNSLKDFFSVTVCGKNSQQQYFAFLHRLFQDGLLSLFEKYPVLGRLLATTVEFWVEATAEFIQRLTTDWIAIEQHFSPKNSLEQVVDLRANLSDLHNRGRCAIALTFNTGLKLVYKPKHLQMEALYNQVVQWCNENSAPLPLKTFSVLQRGNYGWVEFVNHESCADEAEAHRYYQRSGMILALVYLLQGSDCHSENLIASGEHPVLIDLETLLSHRTKNLEPSDLKTSQTALQVVQKGLEQSVIFTLLLPQWGFLEKDSFNIDISGFGGLKEYEEHILKLRHINTDGMEFGYETVIQQSDANVPKLGDVILSPLNYLEDLVTGFEQMYRFFIKHQQALLLPDSPLVELAHQTVRYLFRATAIYHSILQKSYAPDLLKLGIERSIGIDILSRAFLGSDIRRQLFPILTVECQAIEESDIPFFTTDTCQTHLRLPTGEVIWDLYPQSSFVAMINHIQQKLNETDLAQQTAIIRGMFAARFVEEPLPTTHPHKDYEKVPLSLCSLVFAPCSSQFMQQAVSLAEQLKQTAITGEDGSVTWLGLAYRTTTEGFRYEPIGINLYDGSCGVALFFSALATITQDSQWSDFAVRILQPICEMLQENNSENLTKFARSIGIGGTTGLGSIAYALTLCSQFLEDSTFLSTANQVSSLITPELITADGYFDLTRGVAGTILGLLAVYAINPDDETVLNKAIACALHLLETRTPIEGLKTWKTWNNKALTGFSQGAAGIAYALLRLWEVTQDEQFKLAAQEAIAYESRFFSQEVGNWQDLRSSNPQYQISWAHGAPGIALARISNLSIFDNTQIRQEITLALDTTQKCGIWGVDNLAWGNFGRIETLLVASQILNRPDLLKTAQQWSTQLIDLAQTKGDFALYANIPFSAANPGFFYGTSGIGYQLLRLAHPELPSVLSFKF